MSDQVLHCIKCKSPHTKKHGRGRNASQRFFCGECCSSFTLDGVRGTYTPEFKQSVVEAYCHQSASAKGIVQEYGISTRTLIKRKKDHQKNCSCGL